MDEDGATPPQSVSRYEPLDVPPLVPFWLGCLVAAFVVGVLVGIDFGFPLATHQQYRGPLRPLPTAPRLQSAPARDLAAYYARKSRELSSFGATVPIDVAVRKTARDGWGPPK